MCVKYTESHLFRFADAEFFTDVNIYSISRFTEWKFKHQCIKFPESSNFMKFAHKFNFPSIHSHLKINKLLKSRPLL